MKQCLECEKDFEPKNKKGKFCSGYCRLSYFRKHGKKSQITKLDLKLVYNELLDLAQKLSNGTVAQPKVYDAPRLNHYTADEPKQWQEPKKEKSEIAFLNDISKCEEECDYKSVYDEIQKSGLPKSAKDRLFANMRISNMNR